MLPKLILSDIDGVWTDGGMFYDESGNEFKKFNTYDSAGILFARLLNIPCGIITGEDVNSVRRRVKKLNIEIAHYGVKDKVEVVDGILRDFNISYSDVAYIGDDINDFHLLRKVGLSACPNSAPNYIQEIVDWKLSKNGGEGVFREFVEKIMTNNNIRIDEFLEKGNFKLNQ